MKTIELSWEQLVPAWNTSCDKRYNECLERTTPPCIIHEDDHELTRFEYFEKEHNIVLTPPGDGYDKYQLTFSIEQDATFFALKWL